MSSEEAYVPGVVRWVLVFVVAGLVLVAAFWRPDQFVESSGPLDLVSTATWVEAFAFAVLTLFALYALTPAGVTNAVAPLVVPIFVTLFAVLVEAGQVLAFGPPFEPVGTAVSVAASVVVALVWDAGRRAAREPTPLQ